MKIGNFAYDRIQQTRFSYPFNSEFPNSVSFSGIQASLLIAYASDKNIIILAEGKYIHEILTGHKHRICTVTFECNEPHIISCDVEGNCFFWFYLDNTWNNTMVVKLNTRVTCMSWHNNKRKICYSSAEGLFMNNVSTFENKDLRIKLYKKSCFCKFNYNGSLLASHNKDITLTIFFIGKKNLFQVIQHPEKIELFDFHPKKQEFLTITENNILRIWVLSNFSNFVCTSAVKVPYHCVFLREPMIFNGVKPFGTHAPTKLLYVNNENKIFKIDIDDDGIINEINIPRFQKITKKGTIKAAYKTNNGSEALIIYDDSISLISKTPHRFGFHKSNIVQSEFSPNSDFLFTKDQDGCLFLWSIFNPYKSNHFISENVNNAVWLSSNNLLYVLNDNNSFIYNVVERTKEKSKISLNGFINNIYVINNELFVLKNDSVVFKEKEIKIDKIELFSFSKNFNNHFLLILKLLNKNQINIYIGPEMIEIPYIERDDIVINSISAVSLNCFVILTNEKLEFWYYLNGKFSMKNQIYLPGMKGIYANTTEIGGNIFSYDSKRIYIVSNGVTPVLSSKNTTMIRTNYIGHLCIFSNESFRVLPRWCMDNFIQYNQINSLIKGIEPLINVTRSKNIMIPKITSPVTSNYMISPLTMILQSEINIIQSTLFYLLEFSLLDKLSDCKPQQVPAIPNQYPIDSALKMPINYINESHLTSLKILQQVNEDIDMFGLRYILPTLKSPHPPSYFALYLSFSSKQSQIVSYLSKIIDSNNLSKFNIASSIHLHSLLVRVVKASLLNTWKHYQKVEPVALLYVAMGNQYKVSKLYKIADDNARSEFFNKDFSQEKNRKSALKNAYSSLSHQNFEMAATLFLLANEIKLCINIVCNKLKDPLLGFLIIRLYTKSNFNSDEMKNFLEKVEWNDEIIPVLISNLLKDNKCEKLLKNLILEDEKNKNISYFGDRRLALFQIYHYISKKDNIDIGYQVSLNLLFDGLAPLAKYLMYFINCNTYNNKICYAEKESDKSDEETTVDCYSFNFGGNNTLDNYDDYSWSSSYEEEESIKSEENNTAIHKETIIFEEYLQELINIFCNFYDENYGEQTSKFALRFGFELNNFMSLNIDSRNIMIESLSKFIDFCVNSFLYSAMVPIKPYQLLSISLSLFKMLNRNSTLSTLSLVQNKHNNYNHSIYFGLFVVQLWTYNIKYIYKLLSINQNEINDFKDMILVPHSLFNVGFSSSKFPDLIPNLLIQYRKKNINIESIERDRLLVMFLIFRKTIEISKQIDLDSENNWTNLLKTRYKSLKKTLKFHQIALGCPSIEVPEFCKEDYEPENHIFVQFLFQKHQEDIEILKKIQNKSMKKLPYPPIFRNFELSVKEKVTVSSKLNQIQDIISMHLDDKKLVLLSDGKIYTTELQNLKSIKEIRDSTNFISLIRHPDFNLFLSLSQNSIKIFDYEQYCSYDYNFISSSKKIKCAAFSPNGTKLVVCSSKNIDIYQLDLTKATTNSKFSRNIQHQITAIAWIDNNSTFAISYQENNFGYLIILNTFIQHNIPINIDKEWGIINTIKVDYDLGFLVIGTESGIACIFDIKMDFERVCIYSFDCSIHSISSLHSIFVVGTENGEIVVFDIKKPRKTSKLHFNNKLNAISITKNYIIAVGETNKINIWYSS